MHPVMMLILFFLSASLLTTTTMLSITNWLTFVTPVEDTASHHAPEFFDTIDRNSDIRLHYDMKAEKNFRRTSLNGQAASDPCCINSKDSTYCFFRDLMGVISYRSIEKGSQWTSMGQYAVGDVECVQQGNGDITVIVIDITNTMTVNTLKSGEWSGWMKTNATQLMEVPGCIARRNNLINCIYRNQKNEAVFISATDNRWEPVYPVGGRHLSPVACHGDDNTIWCYSTNFRFHLQVLSWQVGRGIRPWKQLGNYFMTGRPSVTTHGLKNIDIFTIGPGSHLLWEQRNERGRYLNWRSLGGPLGWRPECVGMRDTIHCYVVSARSYFMTKRWNGSKWSSWRRIRRGYVGTPSCQVSLLDENVVNCFVRNAKTAAIDVFEFQNGV